jgi:hypothetical protein
VACAQVLRPLPESGVATSTGRRSLAGPEPAGRRRRATVPSTAGSLGPGAAPYQCPSPAGSWLSCECFQVVSGRPAQAAATPRRGQCRREFTSAVKSKYAPAYIYITGTGLSGTVFGSSRGDSGENMKPKRNEIKAERKDVPNGVC